MAKNDYFIVVFKILSYFYNTMKDGTQLSIIKNEILAKEKSIQDSLRYKLPKKEIDFVKSQISEYKEKYSRIKNENTKKL